MSKVVYSESERDMIPMDSRFVGMSVLIVNEFILVNGINNSNWTHVTPTFTGEIQVQIKDVFIKNSTNEESFTLSRMPIGDSEQVFIRGISRNLSEYSIIGNILTIKDGISKKDELVTVVYNYMAGI